MLREVPCCFLLLAVICVCLSIASIYFIEGVVFYKSNDTNLTLAASYVRVDRTEWKKFAYAMHILSMLKGACGLYFILTSAVTYRVKSRECPIPCKYVGTLMSIIILCTSAAFTCLYESRFSDHVTLSDARAHSADHIGFVLATVFDVFAVFFLLLELWHLSHYDSIHAAKHGRCTCDTEDGEIEMETLKSAVERQRSRGDATRKSSPVHRRYLPLKAWSPTSNLAQTQPLHDRYDSVKIKGSDGLGVYRPMSAFVTGAGEEVTQPLQSSIDGRLEASTSRTYYDANEVNPREWTNCKKGPEDCTFRRQIKGHFRNEQLTGFGDSSSAIPRNSMQPEVHQSAVIDFPQDRTDELNEPRSRRSFPSAPVAEDEEGDKVYGFNLMNGKVLHKKPSIVEYRV